MAAILDAAGADRAVLGGMSLGGYLSLAFNLVYPSRWPRWCWSTRGRATATTQPATNGTYGWNDVPKNSNAPHVSRQLGGARTGGA